MDMHCAVLQYCFDSRVCLQDRDSVLREQGREPRTWFFNSFFANKLYMCALSPASFRGPPSWNLSPWCQKGRQVQEPAHERQTGTPQEQGVSGHQR